ncbi:hypothetical protein [Sorangium sp. So ce764]|uniref:hypothetical protein n=1 Tax=unclassified Sorangium TaxID=2621164 RepID=UPI003F602531
MARADGTYAEAEKAAVARAAALLGVEQATVKSIEAATCGPSAPVPMTPSRTATTSWASSATI